MRTYELLYEKGGHSGPWLDLETAVEGAKRVLRGCKSEHTVYIVPRDKRVLDKHNAVRVVRREEV